MKKLKKQEGIAGVVMYITNTHFDSVTTIFVLNFVG